MFAHPFMQYAFFAGTAVALAAGLVGYFLVLRAQVFTADALSHVAFTGALAALAAGLDARIGLFAVTIPSPSAWARLGTARPPRRRRHRRGVRLDPRPRRVLPDAVHHHPQRHRQRLRQRHRPVRLDLRPVRLPRDR